MSNNMNYLLTDADDISVKGYGAGSESFETIIRSKAEEFAEAPAKFPSENSIEAALREDLQNEQEIKITGGFIRNSFNEEKTKFGDKLSECTRIPAVQSQINIGYSSSFETDNNTWTVINEISDGRAEDIEKKLGKLHKAGDVTDADIDTDSLKEIDQIGEKTAESIKEGIEQYRNQPPKPDIDDIDIQLEHIKDLADKVAEAKENDTNDDIDRSNLSVDLAVLTEARHPALYKDELFIDGHSKPTDNALEFCVAGGAQFFPPSGIEHAIEIKYFKTTARPGKGLEDDDDPPRWDRLKGDIIELEMLQKKFRAKSAHLLIFSNHHIFEKYKGRKKGLEDWCSEKNVNLWYIYPDIK